MAACIITSHIQNINWVKRLFVKCLSNQLMVHTCLLFLVSLSKQCLNLCSYTVNIFAEYVKAVKDVLFTTLSEDLSETSKKHKKKAPEPLCKQFPDRRTKEEGIKRQKERKELEQPALYPSCKSLPPPPLYTPSPPPLYTPSLCKYLIVIEYIMQINIDVLYS